MSRHTCLLAALALAGVSSSSAPAADPPPKPHVFNRVVVVAVGINDYPKLDGTGNLKYAESDASEFAKLMADRYGYETRLLLGSKGDGTRVKIERTLKDTAKELGPSDALIVYFSGHGHVLPLPGSGEAGFLIPADARIDVKGTKDEAAWNDQTIDMDFLTGVANQTKARHVVLLVDACYSGFLARQKGVIDRWDLKTMLFDRSRTVMTATTQRQPAMEDDGSKHGYFTAALLKSLTNAECASVDDLFLPVRKSVADRTSGRMLPKLTAFGDGDGMFVFIPKDVDAGQLAADLDDKVLGGEPLAAKGLKGVAARARDRQARRTTYEEFLELVSLYDDSGRAVRPVGPTGREKAFERFQENAAGGDAWATAALHVCYHRGLGVDPDPALALAWARRAGAFGRPAGLADFLLGRCFEYGLGVPADNPERNRRAARDLYAKSADAGFAPGRWAAGAGLLAAGKGDEIGTARRRLEDASRGGVARADISLGDLLRAGAGATHADPAAARERYSLAAERGAPDAHARLYLLLTDEGPLRHAVEAEGHLRKGVALRNPAAQYWLGREHAHDGMHARRLDLKEDFAAARELFDAAVAQGHVPALAWSAVLYARGLGGPADPKLARERVDAGAKANDPFAITLRGAWHAERALGVYEPDDGVAMTLISRAASMNYPQALYYKGYMIMRLRIVPLPAGTTVFNPRTKEALHSFVLAILAAKAAREPTVVQDSTDYLKSFRAEIPDELELVGTDIGSLSPDLVTARDVAESWYQHNPDTFYEFGKAFNCRVKLNPKLPKHWSNHKESAGLVAATEAALGQGRLDDARTLLDKALRIDPNVARVHFFHGRVLSALGRHKESRVALGEAVRLDPSDSAARELLDKLPKE